MNRAFLYFTAIVLVIVAAGLLFIGLAFLIVAAKSPGDLLPALAMLAVGGVLLGWSLGKLKALAAATPDNIDTQVDALAASHGGELTIAEVVGELGISQADAQGSLHRLVSRGVCRSEPRNGTEFYIFAGLKQTMKVKKCGYCGNVYPVAQAGRQCPSCGGNLDIVDQE
jgi:hypothetical protein